MIRNMHESTRPNPVDSQVQYWRDRAMNAEHNHMLEYSRCTRANAMLAAAVFQRDTVLKNVDAGLLSGTVTPESLEKIDQWGVDRYHQAMREYGLTERNADGNYVVSGPYLAHGTAKFLRVNIKSFMAAMVKFRKAHMVPKKPTGPKKSKAA
jgi:hypothetical protein